MPLMAEGASVFARAMDSGDDPSTWLVALVSALAGGICGSILTAGIDDRRQRRRTERSALALREALRVEIQTILDEAETRAAEVPEGSVRRDAPLPTQVWTFAVASAESALDVAVLRGLFSFYRQVDEANYWAAQAATYLLIASSSSDRAAADRFAREASRVSTAPYERLISSSGEALRLLNSS